MTGSGDRGLESLIHDSLAGLHRDRGRLDDAWTHARLAARLARETAMTYAEAASQHTMGTIHQANDRHEEAIEAFTSAVSLSTATKVDYVHAQALTGLAVSKAHLDACAEARHHAVAAIAHARRGDYRVLEGNALTALAFVELRAGQLTAATAAAEEALAVHHETGHRQGVSRTREILAAIP